MYYKYRFLSLFLLVFVPFNFSLAESADTYQNHLDELSKMANDQLKEKFSFTQIVNNNIPKTIEFWTESYCPFEDINFSYTIPYDFELVSCERGEKGSHGGCPTCEMSKIELKVRDVDNFYQSFDFPYKQGEMKNVFDRFGITDDISRKRTINDNSKGGTFKNDYFKYSGSKERLYIEIDGKKYGPYQEISFTGNEEYPAFKYRSKNYYYANIGGNVFGPYNGIVSIYYDSYGYLIFYKKDKNFYINLNNKVEVVASCDHINLFYSEGKYMYDCILEYPRIDYHNDPYDLVVGGKAYRLGDAPDPNGEADCYRSEIYIVDGKFIVPFFRYKNYQQFLYYEGMIFGSYDLFKSEFYVKNNVLYFVYSKAGTEYLKIIKKIK